MKRLSISIMFLIFMIAIGSLCCQNQAESNASYSPYWNQRASHFRQLPNTKGEIIFLGDSITDGCNWTELFNDVRIKNRGISGDVTPGILTRLDEVVESKPTKIFLMIGINDLAIGFSPEQIVNNIKAIVKSIQKESPDTLVYLEGILPVNSDYSNFPNHNNKTQEILGINRVLKRLAEEYGVTYIDLHSRFIVDDYKLNPEYTNDGLHLTGAGYMAWKEEVEPYVLREYP